jgi:hypothetical protein
VVMFELTGNMDYALPTLIAVVVAVLTSTRLSPSLYEDICKPVPHCVHFSHNILRILGYFRLRVGLSHSCVSGERDANRWINLRTYMQRCCETRCCETRCCETRCC